MYVCTLRRILDLLFFYKPALKLVEYMQLAAESKSSVMLKASTFYTLCNCSSIFINANVRAEGVGNGNVVFTYTDTQFSRNLTSAGQDFSIQMNTYLSLEVKGKTLPFSISAP